MKITALRPYGLGLMVLLAAWFCYWRTAGMTLISYSDSAELVAASYTWGIPHAPGYPLYMLLGKVWSFFLGGDVARRYSLLSCIWGSLTVFLVFLSVKRLAGSVAAAVLAAAGLAFAYHFWLYSLVPEISALNGFFGAAIIYWVVRQSGKNLDWKALGSLGLIYGLSMTHHHTLLLWLPALGCYLFVSWPRNQVNRRRLLFLFGCVAIGLLPYIYLPVASHFHPVFNGLHDASPAGIFKFITRQNYGSLVLASAYSSLSPEVMTASLGFYFQCLLKSFFWTGLLLGTAGLYHLRRRKEGVFLMLAFFCSGPLLFAISRIPAQTFSEKGVLEKLLSLSLVAWAVLAGSGIAWLLESLKKNRALPVMAAILLFSFPPLWALTSNWQKVDKSSFTLSHVYIFDLFKCVAPGGVLLIHGDSSLFSARYLQAVENFRPDISIYNTSDLLDNRLIQENLGRRPVYFAGLPGNEFSRWGVNGNPYYLKPRALVFEVTALPPEYSDDQALWDSFEFKRQWKISDFEDVYAKETLWFYAVARFNTAALLLPLHRGREAFLELQHALEIYPEFPEARRLLESNYTPNGY